MEPGNSKKQRGVRGELRTSTAGLSGQGRIAADVPGWGWPSLGAAGAKASRVALLLSFPVSTGKSQLCDCVCIISFWSSLFPCISSSCLPAF